MSSISRREFIAGLGASFAPIHFAHASEDQNIVVIGAGLAGLAAAYELKQAGQNVTVLEQSSRVGGRVKTVRGHFDDDAWVDVGGQSAGAMYGYYVHYCTKFGLKFKERKEVTVRPDVLLHLQGKLYSAGALRKDPTLWPLELHEHEKAVAPFRLLSHYLTPIAEKIARVENVLRPEFQEYDSLSLRDFLVDSGASDAAIGLIDHTLNYNSVETVSALSALRDSVRSLSMRGSQTITLENGNSSLTEAFAKELAGHIQLNRQVVSVTQDGNGVQLVTDSSGERESLRASRVILAIPFTALSKIGFLPELPVARQKIIKSLPYTQIAQTYLQTKTRFWEKNGPVAAVVSDGPLERLFNASDKMQDGRGLLVNWVNGTGTKTIQADDSDDHLDRVISELRRIWPESEGQIERTLTNNWSHSYVEGAYAHYAPGQMAAYANEIPKPVGRLHFAGEHTELVAPGMEGALRSGRRASSEILDVFNG